MKMLSVTSMALASVLFIMVSGCATNNTAQSPQATGYPYSNSFDQSRYADAMPRTVNYGKEKVIVVNPRVFAWGAYDAQGNFVKGGIASAGGDFCPDDNAPCRSTVGTFRIYAMKGEECRSKTYPRPEGGSKMPYCMFYHKGESLHGSPDHMMTPNNISHGCVHMRIPDAEWLQTKFAKVGTKVVVMPY